MRTLCLLLLAACSPTLSDTALADDADHFVLRGGVVVGQGPVDVEVRDGRIVAIGADADATSVVDVSGKWLVPAFIDSHVHFAYDPRLREMLDGGVVGGVDWAAPEKKLGSDSGRMAVRWAGPMITAQGGYPTAGWGAGGYGLQVANGEEAAAAVGRLADAGAAVIKLPITGPPVLDDASLSAAVEAAHARGLKVGAHALSAEGVGRAARAGVDLLVHTPVEAIDPEHAGAFEAVIPTLSAFGVAPTTLANLRALEAGGAQIFYGTDFGNARATGVSESEIDGMVAAGLDGAAILAAGTDKPAAYFGFADLGAIAVGKHASLLVLAEDPLVVPQTLARPEVVYVQGVRR